MTALPAYVPSRSAVTSEIEVPALVQILEPRARSVSVLLGERSSVADLSAGASFVQSMALLPVDPEADAEFAKFKKTLIKAVPRRVIRRR